MNTELIIIREYCIHNRIEFSFIEQLQDEGLIEIIVIDDESYITTAQLQRLEQYVRWHYDLSINVEGIDVIRNLLDRMDDMQKEINMLRQQIRLID